MLAGPAGQVRLESAGFLENVVALAKPGRKVFAGSRLMRLPSIEDSVERLTNGCSRSAAILDRLAKWGREVSRDRRVRAVPLARCPSMNGTSPGFASNSTSVSGASGQISAVPLALAVRDRPDPKAHRARKGLRAQVAEARVGVRTSARAFSRANIFLAATSRRRPHREQSE